MAIPKRMNNQGHECSMPGCDEPAKVRGLCGACYAWERYHFINQHGVVYMREAKGKAERMVRRCDTKITSRATRLRSVKGGRG